MISALKKSCELSKNKRRTSLVSECINEPTLVKPVNIDFRDIVLKFQALHECLGWKKTILKGREEGRWFGVIRRKGEGGGKFC